MYALCVDLTPSSGYGTNGLSVLGHQTLSRGKEAGRLYTTRAAWSCGPAQMARVKLLRGRPRYLGLESPRPILGFGVFITLYCVVSKN